MAFESIVPPSDTRPPSQYTKTNKPTSTMFGQFVAVLENGVGSPSLPLRVVYI